MDDRLYYRGAPTLPLGDLRMLCRELGLRQMGRKEELHLRLVAHLQSEEGSHRCFRGGPSTLLRNFLAVSCMPMPAYAPKSLPSELGLLCVCAGTGCFSQTIQCPRCQTFQHRGCLARAVAMRNYECPLCQMRQMDPFEQVLGVLLVGTLVQAFGNGMAQRQFLYSQDMHAKLLELGKPRMVQIRCVRLDGEGYVQHWPKDCAILVNGRTIFTVAPPPPSSPRKRVDLPLNITNLSAGSMNQVMVLKQREDDCYAFGIFVVEHLDMDAVYNRFLFEKVLTADAGRTFVRNRTCGSEDITADASRQSLKCPLTRLLPDIPARGWQCRHIQCFDLYPYILMQVEAKTNRWRCPICFSMVVHMTVDKFIKSIIERAKVIQGCESVEFQPSGLYKLIADEQADMSDDDDVPQKRPNESVDQCLKKPKLEIGCKRLGWKDFISRKPYAEAVTREILYGCLTYQYAVQAHRGRRRIPNGIPRPPPTFQIQPIVID